MTAPAHPAHCPACGSVVRPWGGCPHCTLAAMLSLEPDAEEHEPEEPVAFGDYELLEEIARGGAGVVWRARQRRLGRVVALKILRESTLPGEEAARRFRFEGETVARLRHPHIVTVHEIGEAGGRWFMSMDLMAGGTLAERLQRGLLSARESARLLVKVARAVQHAHEHGVIHRDLKPGNILLDAAGEPHVSDFGLARDAGEVMDFTMTGVILGTPAYMSPEQAAGLTRGLTTATDVYALGAIFYEMLTGAPVFRGATHLEVLRQTREEEPLSPARVSRGLEADAATMCLKCLEKNPAARYGSAGALADDLERWLRGEPIFARTSTAAQRLWKWMRRHPARAALAATVPAALIAVSVVSTVFSWKVERERVATLHRVAQQHTQRALHFMENGDALRGLLPLAEAIEIGSGSAEADELNRMRFASTLRMGPRLAGLWLFPEGDPVQGQFPTAGETLLITAGRTARLAHGPALEHAAEITGADVNADGTRVVCGTADGRWTLWDAPGGRRIADGPGRVRAFPRSPACHTDGTIAGGRFVIVEGRTVRQLRLEDGAPAAPDLEHGADVQWAALSPDARKLFVFTTAGLLITASADQPESQAEPSALYPGAEFHSVTPLDTQGMVTLLSGEHDSFVFAGWEYTHPETTQCKHAPMGFNSPAPVLATTWMLRSNAEGKPGYQACYLTASSIGATRRTPWSAYDFSTSFPHSTRAVAGCFDDGGRTALTLAVNGAAQIWDVEDEGRRGPHLWCIGPPLEARLTREGRTALIRTAAPALWLWKWRADDGAMRAFSAEEWAAARESREFTTPPAATAQLADGRLLTAAIADAQSVVLTSTGPGSAAAPPIFHPQPVTAVSFSRDGRLLCTLWGGKFGRIWETATSAPVTPPFEHPDIATAAWHADGRTLATIGKTGSVRLWDLTPATLPAAELKTLARLLSAHRIIPGSDSGLIPLTAEELRAAWEAAGAGQP